jgi:hypothetical protein
MDTKAKWKALVDYIFQDPRFTTQYGDPKTVAVVRVALASDYNDILQQAQREKMPTYELIDPLILNVEVQLGGWPERLKHPDLGTFTSYQCVWCKGGLGLTNCPTCGVQFSDDGFRCAGPQFSPSTVVEALNVELKKAGLDYSGGNEDAAKELEDRFYEDIRHLS